MNTMTKAMVFCRINPMNKILNQNLSSFNYKPKHQLSNTFHTATMEECHSNKFIIVDNMKLATGPKLENESVFQCDKSVSIPT